MTLYWIDVLHPTTGAKQGDGPITSALNWTQTRQRDRSGPFTFTMPAADPRAELLRLKYHVACYAIDGGVLQELGAGIINDIALTAGPDGAALYTVSGDDLLHEFNYRSVGELALYDVVESHPSGIATIPIATADNDEATGVVYLSNTYDLQIGDVTTGDTITDSNVRANWFYVLHVCQFHGVKWTLTQPNTDTNSDTLTVEYWGTGGWTEITNVTDGTFVSGAFDLHLAQNGTMTWDIPSDWVVASGQPAYKVRIAISDSSNITISDVTVLYNSSTADALAKVDDYFPAGWAWDTIVGYDSIAAMTEVGSELITNGSFTFGGSGGDFNGGSEIDDGATDTFTGWTNVLAAGERAEASQVVSEIVAKLITNGTTTSSNAWIYQDVAVAGGKDYLFQALTRGDGTQQGAYRIYDVTGGTGTALPFNVAITNPVDTGITGIAFTEFEHTFTTPAACTTIQFRLYGPWNPPGGGVSGYAMFDHVSLKQRMGGEVYMEMASETVLETLIRIAESTGEHFILAPRGGRYITWLRTDTPSSGIRCVGNTDPQAVEDQDSIALIVDIQEVQSAYEIVSRVYPFGGGTGDERVTLAYCTRGVPTGYTLDKTNNYLKRDAAETAYGEIHKRLDCPDIVQLTQTTTQLQLASNALFDRAYAYLESHSATDTHPTTGDVPKTYNITLAKCDTVLYPGYTIKVEYDAYNGDGRYIHVDDTLLILSATVNVSEAGIRTVAIQCSTTDVAPQTDNDLIVDMLRKQRALMAHKPG